MAPIVTALVAPPTILGECPVWSDDGQGALYWIDIDASLVFRYQLYDSALTSHRVEGRPGSLVLTTDPNTLVLAVEHQILALDWQTGQTVALLDVEEPNNGNRLNDGRCDPAGRYVVGSMYAEVEAGRHNGTLYQIADRRPLGLRYNIGVPNGLAFDSERSRMYFADSPTRQVLKFDYDAETGQVGEPEPFFDYQDWPGFPDGACVDADGCYWSASVYGWQLLRITPEGVVDQVVEVPVQLPTMPCFGGPDLDTLFVTSIAINGSYVSQPGRDGFEPGATLMIEGLDVQGRREPRLND